MVGISVTDYLLRCWPPYLFIQLRHMLADRLEDRMPAIAARTLVITGDRDPIARVSGPQRSPPWPRMPSCGSCTGRT